MPSHRNWPGKGRQKSKTCLFGAFQLLQGCNSQEVAVTWQEMMSCSQKWQEVTRKWCLPPEVAWRRLRRPKTRALVAFQLQPVCNSQEVAVTSLKMISQLLEVTTGDPEVTLIHRKWPGEGCRRPKTHALGAFQPYWAVVRRKWQSHDRKWCHSGKLPEVTLRWHRSTGNGLEKAVEG